MRLAGMGETLCLAGIVRRVEIQRSALQRIRHMLLGFEANVQLQVGTCKACVQLKVFTDQLAVGHRHHGIAGEHGLLAQYPKQHLSDTFWMSAGLIICGLCGQGFNGIAVKREPGVRTAQFDNRDSVGTDINADTTVSAGGQKSWHFYFP